MNDKAVLRERCLAVRESLSPDQVWADSRAVCQHLSKWSVFQRAYIVLSFLAFRNEIDLSFLFDAWPAKMWLAPCIVRDKEKEAFLSLHCYDPTRLVRHPFGMLEPDANLPAVDPSQVEVIFVPGVVFDRQGGRLGFGGGFYDRLLPLASQAVRVGITYEELILDDVPVQPWDCHVDWLATPQGVIETTYQEKRLLWAR